MSDLKKSSCEACVVGAPSLSKNEIENYLSGEISDWSIVEPEGIRRFERIFKFKNFTQALAFSVKVGILAEKEDHHPLIQTEWGKVKIQWWTHKIKGVHKNDAICAAKTDALYGN